MSKLLPRVGGCATALAVLAGGMGALPASAPAAYGPGAEAASAAGVRLGSATSDGAALSADGRYVVFSTAASELLGDPPDPSESYTNGIVRRDLLTGAVALVAPPRRVRRSDGAEVYAGSTAVGASISGDGRFVIFRSEVALTDGDRNAGTDVYVRDMTRPPTDAGAYRLVSALDGGDDAPVYADADGGSRTGRRGAGISDDGTKAVFWTRGPSNLPGGGAASTPTHQVFLRDLETRRTELLTRTTADGAAVARPADDLLVDPTAVISGDGSAVAWIDPDAAAQTRLLPGEPDPPLAYLWRDARADTAPTRRVAGRSDLDDPACPGDTPYDAGSQASGPCDGPFVDGEAGTDSPSLRPLSISGDGRRLLFLTQARRRPYDPTLDRPGSLYLADMSPGVSRKAGVQRILSIPGSGSGGATVSEAILSRDGRRVAFASNARIFDGGRQLGDFPADGQQITNLYVLDPDAGTIQRASIGFDGADFHGGLLDPDAPGTYTDPGLASLAADADLRTLAFSAEDGNLFPGDANAVRDVEVVRGSPGLVAAVGTTTALAAPPAAVVGAASPSAVRPPAATHPVIGFPRIGRDGVARITVRVPAAGRLTAAGTALRRAHRLTVARATSRPKRASTVTLTLKLTKAARRALRRQALHVSLSVRYVPAAAGAATTATRSYTLARRPGR
ncbi:MAG TPA: hypothetical protein VNT03_09285 [Baekduia sp.]|nr:hypothetical protein [Baekduia sp.]